MEYGHVFNQSQCEILRAVKENTSGSCQKKKKKKNPYVDICMSPTSGILAFTRFQENLMSNLARKTYTFFFYKQPIFDHRPENCLSFSKKLFSNCLVDGLLISIV